jgi:hypothetical protein
MDKVAITIGPNFVASGIQPLHFMLRILNAHCANRAIGTVWIQSKSPRRLPAASAQGFRALLLREAPKKTGCSRLHPG